RIFARLRLLSHTNWEFLRAGGFIAHKLGIFAGWRFYRTQIVNICGLEVLSHTNWEYLRAAGSYRTQSLNVCGLEVLSLTNWKYLRAKVLITHKAGIFAGWKLYRTQIGNICGLEVCSATTKLES